MQTFPLNFWLYLLVIRVETHTLITCLQQRSALKKFSWTQKKIFINVSNKKKTNVSIFFNINKSDDILKKCNFDGTRARNQYMTLAFVCLAVSLYNIFYTGDKLESKRKSNLIFY